MANNGGCSVTISAGKHDRQQDRHRISQVNPGLNFHAPILAHTFRPDKSFDDLFVQPFKPVDFEHITSYRVGRRIIPSLRISCFHCPFVGRWQGVPSAATEKQQ